MKKNEIHPPVCMLPLPILRESRVRNGCGSDLIIDQAARGDRVNFTRCEIHLTCIVDGVKRIELA